MPMPSAYTKGYESARALDPERARKYVAHTVIGDPEADALLEELAPLGQEELGRLIQIGMDGDERALRDVPAVLREFFASCAAPPDWLDLARAHARHPHVPPQFEAGAGGDGGWHPGGGIRHEHRQVVLHHGQGA